MEDILRYLVWSRSLALSPSLSLSLSLTRTHTHTNLVEGSGCPPVGLQSVYFSVPLLYGEGENLNKNKHYVLYCEQKLFCLSFSQFLYGLLINRKQ